MPLTQVSTMNEYQCIEDLDDCIEYLEQRIRFYQTHRIDHRQDPKPVSQILDRILDL